MARELRCVDISDIPVLLKLAREVHVAKTPIVLRDDSEDLAVIVPANAVQRPAKRTKTKADYDAFLSAAGSWKDVDTDKLIEDIYESRRRSSRPPVEL